MLQGFGTNEAYNVYKTYSAIKRHFDDAKYDYFTYNGKIKGMSLETFQTKHDAYFYAKLAKQTDWKNRILANIVHNSKCWIKDILDSEEVYTSWK